MHDVLFSDSFRKKYPDSFGNGWKFTWHIPDHVGYEYNPRRRDMGFHNIFDYYREKIWEKKFTMTLNGTFILSPLWQKHTDAEHSISEMTLSTKF